MHEILYDSATYILSVIDDWTNALKDGYLIDVIYIGYGGPLILFPQKAFG